MENCEQDQRQNRSKAVKVNGNTPDDRVKKWYNHSKNLLDDCPTFTDEEDEIETGLENVDIVDGSFTMTEL